MRKFLFLLLLPTICWGSGRTDAQHFDLNIQDLPIKTVIQQIYGDLLHRQYSVSSDLPSKTITFNASVPASDIDATLDNLLLQSGVAHEQVNGIDFFRAVSSSDAGGFPPAPDLFADLPSVAKQIEQVDFYRPRYRRPADLQEIANKMTGQQFTASVDQVIVGGDREAVASVLRTLNLIDQPNSSVLVKAALLEFTADHNDSSGFGLAVDALRGNLQSAFGSVSFQSDFVRIGGSDVSAVVQAISGDSRFTLLSQPVLRVRNGEKGRVQVGDNTPVLSSTTVQTNGDRIQGIEYRDSGVILEAQPRVLADSIELSISQEVSSFQKNQSSGIDSPVLSQRKLSTVIDTRAGETVIMAGLDAKTEGSGNSGFSLLPDWAKTKSESLGTKQIILVMTVQLIDNRH